MQPIKRVSMFFTDDHKERSAYYTKYFTDRLPEIPDPSELEVDEYFRLPITLVNRFLKDSRYQSVERFQLLSRRAQLDRTITSELHAYAFLINENPTLPFIHALIESRPKSILRVLSDDIVLDWMNTKQELGVKQFFDMGLDLCQVWHPSFINRTIELMSKCDVPGCQEAFNLLIYLAHDVKEERLYSYATHDKQRQAIASMIDIIRDHAKEHGLYDTRSYRSDRMGFRFAEDMESYIFRFSDMAYLICM